MEVKILNESKEELEVQLENVTISEILRVYLNQDSGVVAAAWKRDHPTEKPILFVQTKGKTAKKALTDAVTKIEKDLDKVSADFSKLK